MIVFVDGLVAVLLVVGGFFLLVGSIGLARLPDFFTRLHGPTKASTLGIGSILIASGAYFSVHYPGLSVQELAITLFLFITAPITAHMLAKSALHLKKKPVKHTRNQALLEPARSRRSPKEANTGQS